jgi:hypothetical protein
MLDFFYIPLDNHLATLRSEARRAAIQLITDILQYILEEKRNPQQEVLNFTVNDAVNIQVLRTTKQVTVNITVSTA